MLVPKLCNWTCRPFMRETSIIPLRPCRLFRSYWPRDMSHPSNSMEGFITGNSLQPVEMQPSTMGSCSVPRRVHWIQNVTVEEQYLFADHTPVQLEIHMPVATPTRTIWRLPHSWTQFVPQPQEMAKQYGNYRSDPPTSLENWAQLCEQAVHGAIRTAHSQDPLRHPFASLPRRARGRCQPRKCVKVPLYQPIRLRVLINMPRE